MSANFLTLNTSKTEFCLIGLRQLAKINSCALDTVHSARNLGFIFDEHLTFSNQISTLSKSCYSHIHQLQCIRPFLDFKSASTIATSIVHSKLDYCNSLYYQLNRLQLIQNFLACAIVRTRKSSLLSDLYTGSKLERIVYSYIQNTAYRILLRMMALNTESRADIPRPCFLSCANN